MGGRVEGWGENKENSFLRRQRASKEREKEGNRVEEASSLDIRAN